MSNGYYLERTRIYPHPEDNTYGAMQIAPECFIPGRHLDTGNFDPFTSSSDSIKVTMYLDSAMELLSEIIKADRG